MQGEGSGGRGKDTCGRCLIRGGWLTEQGEQRKQRVQLSQGPRRCDPAHGAAESHSGRWNRRGLWGGEGDVGELEERPDRKLQSQKDMEFRWQCDETVQSMKSDQDSREGKGDRKPQSHLERQVRGHRSSFRQPGRSPEGRRPQGGGVIVKLRRAAKQAEATCSPGCP